jgi:hypothetical protein
MKNKFFLKVICAVATLMTAAIASAEPVIIEITAQDLAPYYDKRYQHNAAVTVQPEENYAAQAPMIIEERRATPASNIDLTEDYFQADKPLLRPMRGVLPSYGLTEEYFESMGYQINN